MILYTAELLALLVAVSAVAVIFVRDLFALIALLAVYSALLASLLAVMGAVDVAFMEAVVGTSLSTVFFMGLMWWIDPREVTPASKPQRLFALAASLGLGGILLHGVNALPVFGDPASPASTHISPEYSARALEDMATPNVVAAILADYRSFDTLIEAAVVVTAVLACLLVLKHRDDPIV